MNRPQLSLILLACLSQACNPKSFSNRAPAAAASAQREIEVVLNCSEQEAASQLQTFEIPRSGAKVIVRGTFCKAITAPTNGTAQHLSILVDTSGSMLRNDPLSGSGAQASCKRLSAAQTLWTTLRQRPAAELALLRFSLVSFDTQAQLLTPNEIDASQFEASYLNSRTFCAARSNGATNYDLAFDRTRELLTTLPTTEDKFIFLLTDGLPTAGRTGSCEDQNICEAGAAKVASELKQIPKSQLSVIFLLESGNPSATHSREYLASIASTPDSVRFVKDAAEAAAAVKALVPAAPTTYRDISATAALSGPGLNTTVPISVQAAAELQWSFTTSAINLPGQAASYILRLNSNTAGQPLGPSYELTLVTTVKD